MFIGFLFVLMVVYVNSNMLFVNPLLSAAGFHFFDCQDDTGQQYHVVSRRQDLPNGLVFRPALLTSYIRLEVVRDEFKGDAGRS